MTDYTITCRTKRPDKTLMEGTYTARLATGLAKETGVGLYGYRTSESTVAGVATLTLPPSADLVPPSNYVITFESRELDERGNPVLRYSTDQFTLDGNKTLDQLLDISDVPLTPTLVAQVMDARDEAVAAAAAAAAFGTTNDGIVAAFINALDSDTRAALDAAFVAVGLPGFDLIPIGGQSNPSGRGLPSPDSMTDSSDGRVFQYGATGSQARQIILATEPLLHHDIPSGLGPGLALGRWYASALPLNRRVLLVPGAHGATPLSGGDPSTEEFTWKVGRTDLTNLGVLWVEQIKDARAAAGPNARIPFAVWWQGEDDAGYGISAATYTTDLQDLFAYVRTELDEPDLLFAIVELSPTNIATNPSVAEIDAAHRAVVAADDNVVFVHQLPGATNTGDIVHTNAVGQRFVARCLFDQATAKLFGTPAPTVPAQVTGLAATPAVSSTAITVEWDAIPNANGYTIEYRTNSGPGAWTQGPAVTTALRGTIDHLTPNTSYDIRIRAANAAGRGAYSATITVVTPNPILAFRDTFNRANAGGGGLGTADTGQVWSDPSSKFGIIGNALYHASATATAGTYCTIDTGVSPSVNRETTFYTSAIATAGSALWRRRFRVVDDLNQWFIQHRRATGKYQLYRMVNGQATQIGPDFAAVPSATDAIKIVEQAGGGFQVFVNGTFQVETDDNKFSTASKIGAGHGGAVTAADEPRLDEITVYV